MDFSHHMGPFGDVKYRHWGSRHGLEMISRYSQIQQQAAMIGARLRLPGHVQKIYSTAWYLSFQVRVPGDTFSLVLGRGGGHEGLWVGEGAPPSELRVRDTWLEWCRKNITGALLLGVDMDPGDRAIRLRLQKGGQRDDLYIFWAGRTAFFANRSGEGNWFFSWGNGNQEADGFEVFDEVGRKNFAVDSNQVEVSPSIQELYAEEKKSAEKILVPKKKQKSLTMKVAKIQADLAKIQDASLVRAWLDREDPSSLEGLVEFKLGRLKYKFPPSLLGPWQRREWLYGQVKRLKLAEEKQMMRLREAQADLANDTRPVFKENPLRVARPAWGGVSVAPVAKVVTEEDFVVHQMDAHKVAVGRSAHGNDQIRKLWAKGDDWWVHATHGTSAHAVLKLAREGIPTPEQVTDAARLIAEQSGISAPFLEVLITQVKNVRGVTGKAGMVTYKKEKTLLCRLE